MIDKTILIAALVFIVSVVALVFVTIAGAPRWELVSQSTEETVAGFAYIAAGVSAVMLAILVLMRALR